MQQHEHQGMRLLRQLRLQGKGIFSMQDIKEAAHSVDIPPSQLNRLLFNLNKQGWLVRLKRELYAGVASLPGTIDAHPFAIATHLVQPSAISHWSAMQHHGLTEQIPHTITCSTYQKVVTPSMRNNTANDRLKHGWEIQGIRYEYFTVKKQHFFGIEKVWIAQDLLIPITDKERTLLDVFIYAKHFGGIGEALGALENALSTLDIDKLVKYTIEYDQIATIKRLGWALDYLEVSQQQYQPLLEKITSYYCLLDSEQPAEGPYNKKWKIRNNLSRMKNDITEK